jgi:ubiquinone/menaquinone biosynthesis C-methylase UbiE
MAKRTNFNSIAVFYDNLCQLVFGQYVKTSQIEALEFLQPNSTILIVGGGTGWILDEISKIYPSGLTITYIDISSKMIQLSKKRNSALNTIEFLEAGIENVNLNAKQYDAILTPFLFDAFAQSTANLVFEKLNESLKINGIWLYTDFYLSQKSKYWKRLTIKLMYIFFRLT